MLKKTKEPGIPYTGLCMTCKFEDNCSLKKENNKPVHQCEEFEFPKTANKKNAGEQSRAEKESKKEAYTGLCKNCTKRLDCALTSPSSAIWHCNEYE